MGLDHVPLAELTLPEPSFQPPIGILKRPTQAQRNLAPWARHVDLPAAVMEGPGVALFRQGSQADGAFFIRSGLCKLVHAQRGRDEVIVGLRGAGWFVAADVAILDRPYSVTAVTLTRCEISRIEAQRFRELVRSSPELSWHLHQMQSKELCLETGRLADLGTLSARERLLQFLDRLHRGVPQDGESTDEVRIRVPLKQREIAQLIAVAPPYLCALVRELEREQLLRRETDTFILRRRAKLASGAPGVPRG